MRVVLLHALPFDGRMWRAVQDLLGGEALTPSLYGFGTRLEDWARGVLDLAGDEPFVVVGCSVGGSCALEVARAAPDQVAAIVLVGAKTGVRPDPALRDRAVQLLAERGLEAAWRAFWRPLFGRGTPPGVLAEAQRMALDQDVDGIIRGVRAFHDRRDLTPFAQAWPKPLVVVSGAQDRTPPPATAAQITTTAPTATGAPHRRLHLVPRCGHYVPLENPTTLHTLLTPYASTTHNER